MVSVVALALLLWLGRRFARHRPRLRRFLRLHIFYWVAATIFWIPMFFLPVDGIVDASRRLGPLAMMGLQLLAAFLMAVKIRWGWLRARRWALPAFVLWALATVVLGVSHWMLMPSATEPGRKKDASPAEETALTDAFTAWIEARPARARGPSFIVAAEGGGIFAASAVATFLSALRDREPAFADRVFAITGVSGGAVGAALYSTLESTDGQHETTSFLAADHLSPILAVMVPDLVWTFGRDLLKLALTPFRFAGDLLKRWHIRFADADEWWSTIDRWLPHIRRRDTMLELSLSNAAGPASRLSKTIGEHWNGGRATHALILNTTDASDGRTVAFAPFSLRGLQDDEIRSFADADYITEPSERILARAAVSSARFPLVLPPLIKKSGDTKRTFVDGGYADNSGAAVAGAIFAHVRRYAELRHPKIDLRLIVLTSETTNRRPNTTAGWDIFGDLRVPLQAVLSVRAGIGAREVARIAERFASTDANRTVLKIDYGKGFFLGWTISSATLRSISSEVYPLSANAEGGTVPAHVRRNVDTIDFIRSLLRTKAAADGASLDLSRVPARR